jgi:hypothetical protein
MEAHIGEALEQKTPAGAMRTFVNLFFESQRQVSTNFWCCSAVAAPLTNKDVEPSTTPSRKQKARRP